MSSDKSIWFRLGHALERARHSAPSAHGSLEGLSERAGADHGTAVRAPKVPSSDELMAAGVALVVDRVLGGWGKRSSPGLTALLRAAVAGVAAALLAELVRPLLRDEGGLPGLDRDTAGHLLAGLGQGLVYGGVVEPRVPGPALLKGAVYGSVEYAVHPFGGLSGILGRHAPQRRVPFVGAVFDDLDGSDRAYLEHLVFGIALALIYESSASSNGMRPDDE